MKRNLSIVAIFILSIFTVTGARAQDSTSLYKAKCQMCHGADGKGDTPAGQKMQVRDFHGPDASKESDAEWASITKKGKNKMPGYEGKLADDQINDLVKYIRSLK